MNIYIYRYIYIYAIYTLYTKYKIQWTHTNINQRNNTQYLQETTLNLAMGVHNDSGIGNKNNGKKRISK